MLIKEIKITYCTLFLYVYLDLWMNLLSIQIHWIWIQVGIRILGYTINFERKNLKQFERKTIFFFISAFFVKTIRAKCHLKKLFLKFNLWTANLYLKSYIFCLHFILYLHVWIRTPNTDPEGSWIQIRIHNTGMNCKNGSESG